VRAAPELHGAPTTGGGSARPRGGDGESHRSQISLGSHPKDMKIAKKQAVSRTFWLINHQKRRFSLKSNYQNFILRRFLRNKSILQIFTTIAELYLFKVSEVIYTPSSPD
jgi:hypothetical protein